MATLYFYDWQWLCDEYVESTLSATTLTHLNIFIGFYKRYAKWVADISPYCSDRRHSGIDHQFSYIFWSRGIFRRNSVLFGIFCQCGKAQKTTVATAHFA